jgi:hypothetical protein
VRFTPGWEPTSRSKRRAEVRAWRLSRIERVDGSWVVPNVATALVRADHFIPEQTHVSPDRGWEHRHTRWGQVNRCHVCDTFFYRVGREGSVSRLWHCGTASPVLLTMRRDPWRSVTWWPGLFVPLTFEQLGELMRPAIITGVNPLELNALAHTRGLS